MHERRAAEPAGREPRRAAAAQPLPNAVLALQRAAGNAAVGRVLARFVKPYEATFIADQLHDAMDRWGTDEDKIFAALSGITRAELQQVEAEYAKKHKRNLKSELLDELSDSDFKKIAVYQPVGIDSIADQLRAAMKGLGTDENAIYAALAGRSKDEVAKIAAAYAKRHGRDLSADLQDELSKSELMKLGALSEEGAKNRMGQAQQIAEQLRDAIKGPGTNEEAILAGLNGRHPDMVKDIKTAYEKLTGETLEAALKGDLSGDELDQSLNAAGFDRTIEERDTELGGLMVGNFDFDFAGGKVKITVRVKYQYTDDINATERAAFKTRFENAVNGMWKNSGYKLHGEGNCNHVDVPIEVELVESNRYHKVVDVEKQSDSDRRPKIMRDINVNLTTDDHTLAHEFGHVLGLYDEYDGGFLENMMFWHTNRPEDSHNLMASGHELRPRYFEPFRERVQRAAPPGCVYHIVPPP